MSHDRRSTSPGRYARLPDVPAQRVRSVRLLADAAMSVDTEQFWRDVLGRFRPVPTTASPAFVAGEFAKEHWPIPEWLHPLYDLPRDGYYVGIDTPEANQARTDRLRAALAPYFNEPYGDSSPSSDHDNLP